jgi:hypothetical protein
MTQVIRQMKDTVACMNEAIHQLESTQAAVPSRLTATPAEVAVGVDPRHAEPGDVAQVWAAGDRLFIGGERVTAKYQGSFSGVPEQIRDEARDTIPAPAMHPAYQKLVEQFDATQQAYPPKPLPCMCCAEKGRQHVSSADRMPDEVAPSDTLVRALRESIFRTEDMGVGEDAWEALARRVLLALAHYEADSEVF